MQKRSISRRALLETLALGTTAAALAPYRSRSAAALQNLDPKSPSAVDKGYVEDAARVDLKKFPSYVKGSNCENCLLLQGSAGDAYRPCTLFPGKLVSIKGWCSAWTAEM